MKKLSILCGVFLALCLSAHAQVPTGFVRVYQGAMTDANGLAVSNATVCAQAMASNHPISVTVGNGSGSTVTRPVCANVSSGAWSMYLPDGSVSSPLNVGFQIITTDNVSGDQIAQYSNVQPTSVTNSWCSVAGCSMDQLTPDVPLNTLTVQGARGPAGPPGCAIGVSGPAGCGTSMNPQIVNGVANPQQFSGNDLGAQINAAFAAQPGSAGAPVKSAVVTISPAQAATMTVNSPIVIQSSSNFPYVNNPTLDCGGNTLVGGSGLGGQPMIQLQPDNQLAAANSSGEIRNCTFQRDTAGPIIQNLSRLGFKITNVQLLGGSYGYQGVDVQTYWGGYEEQTLLQNVSVAGCGVAGLDFENNGGTGSFLYSNVGLVKFDLDGTCRVGIHLGANGAAFFGTRFKLSFNIGGGSDPYYMLKNDGTILSSQMDFTGEDTGQPTGPVYVVGGSGYTSMAAVNLYRGKGCLIEPTGPGSGQQAGVHMVSGTAICNASGVFPYGASGEGPAQNQSSDAGPSVLANSNGQIGPGAYRQIVSCSTDPNTAIWNSLNCSNRLYTDAKHKLGIGQGFNDAYGVSFQGTTTAGSPNISAPANVGAALHPDDIYTPTLLVVSSCSQGTSPFGPGTYMQAVNQPGGLGTPVTIVANANATTSATCTFQERAINPKFDLTVHGTYGSEPLTNLYGSPKYESHYWDGNYNFVHELNLYGTISGQPGPHYIERLYNAGAGSTFTNIRDCYIDGSGVTDDNVGGNVCYQPGHQHFGSISTIGNESAVGSTCTIGGYITLTINDVPRKVAVCQ